jgi:aminocarboxymuconate-semialdehyde decarboxylase
LILVHPDVRSNLNSLNKYYLQNLIGNPVETATAAGSLLFGGVLEHFPGLKVVFSHGGGVVPYLVGRWQHGHSHRAEPRAKFAGSVEEAFHRLYFDSIVYKPGVLKFLVDSVGADRVLLGTDYSGDMSCWREVPEIGKMDSLADSDKQKILGGNAARLLGIES